MRYLLPFLLICGCFLGGCKKKTVPVIPEIVLTGTLEPADSISLTAVIQTDTSAFFTDTLSVINGSFELKYPTDSLVRINLLYAGKTFPVYMKGGDSLGITLKNDSMHVMGKIKPFMLWSINEYLRNPSDSIARYPSLIRKEIEQYRLQANKVRIGYKIPYVLFRDIKGNNFSTHEAQGNYRLITCWASWDSLSTEQIKQVARLSKKFENKAIAFINLSFDDNDSILKKRVEDLKIPGRNVFMKESFATQNARKTGINTLPYNIVLDAESKVVGMNLFGKQLETYLSEEVKAPAKKNTSKTEAIKTEKNSSKLTPDIRNTAIAPLKEEDRKTAEQPAVRRSSPRKVKLEEKVITE